MPKICTKKIDEEPLQFEIIFGPLVFIKKLFPRSALVLLTSPNIFLNSSRLILCNRNGPFCFLSIWYELRVLQVQIYFLFMTEAQLYIIIWTLNLSIAIHILILTTSPQNLFWSSSKSHLDTLAIYVISNLSSLSSLHTSVLNIATWLPSLLWFSSFRTHTLILFG